MTTEQFIDAIVNSTNSGQPKTSDPPADLGDAGDWIAVLTDTTAEPSERESAALQLEGCNGPAEAVVAALICGLSDADPLLAKTCGLALQTRGSKVVDQLREQGLQHSSAKVRERVAGVFSELLVEGCEIDSAVVDGLLKLIKDRRTGVRKAATTALQNYCEHCGKQPQHADQVKGVYRALIAALETEKNTEVCDLLAETLWMAGSEVTRSVRGKGWYKARFSPQSQRKA